jgi:hypothetical protein
MAGQLMPAKELLADTSHGLSAPMHIKEAVWLTKSVQQSNPYPCGENTIIVSLASSVPFDASCVMTITISGLDGSSTPSTPNLPLEAPVPSQVSQFAKWDGRTDLVVNVTGQFRRYALVTIKFKLTNQDTMKGKSDLIVKAGMPFEDADMDSNSETPGVEYAIYLPQAGDLEPFNIREAAWEVKDIGQTSPFPCANNTITTTLQPSVPIYQSCMSKFTIMGLTGSQTADGDILVTMTCSHSPCNDVISTYGEWNRGVGSLTVSLDARGGYSMQAGVRYIFSIVLINDVKAQPPVLALVTASNSDYISSQPLDRDSRDPDDLGYNIYNAQPGDLYPMYIRNVSWEMQSLNMRDSSNTPCSDNLITITLAPIFNLYASCVTYLQLDGFTGSLTGTDKALRITDPTATFSSAAEWVQPSGTLKLFMDTDMLEGTEYSVSFLLRNGRKFQAPRNISISVPLVSSVSQTRIPGQVLQVISDLCIDCVAGTFSPSETTNSEGWCTCPAGTHSVNMSATCQNCAAGKYSEASASTTCTRCPVGTYNEAIAATVCINCGSGKYLNATGATSSELCQDCAPGRFNDADAASACRDCAVDTYAPDHGRALCLSCPRFENTEQQEGSTGCVCDEVSALMCKSIGVKFES